MRPLRNIWWIGRYTLKESIRNKILRALLILAAVFSSANIFVAELFSWDIGKVSVEFGLATVSLTGIILIFFLGVKLLFDDLERHSIYLVMARPVTGMEYILGKFSGLGMVLLLVTLILGAGSALSTLYLTWRYPAFIPPDFSWPTFLLALGLAWLSLMVTLAIAFFWFNFAKESFVAIILSLSSYLIGQNMELLRRFISRSGGTGGLQKVVVDCVSWIFPNLSFFDLKTVAAYGLAIDSRRICLIVLYGCAYSALLLLFTTICFNRKELV